MSYVIDIDKYFDWKREVIRMFLITAISLIVVFPSLKVYPAQYHTTSLSIQSNTMLNSDTGLFKLDQIHIKMPVVTFKPVAYLRRITAYNAVSWQTSSHP